MRDYLKLYHSYKVHLDLITDNSEFRDLIEALFDYSITGDLPRNLSPIAQMAFSFIKADLDNEMEIQEIIKPQRKKLTRDCLLNPAKLEEKKLEAKKRLCEMQKVKTNFRDHIGIPETLKKANKS